MSYLVVQTCDAENKANPIHWALTGGAAGYAAKYAFPITKKEQLSNNYPKYLKLAKAEVEKEMDKFVKAIKSDAKTNEASKIFSENFLNGKGCERIFESKAFKSAKQTVQEGVNLLAEQYHTLKINGEKNAKTVFDSAVKSFRNTNVFLGAGVLAGVAIALAKNALDANGRKLEEQQRLLDIAAV